MKKRLTLLFFIGFPIIWFAMGMGVNCLLSKPFAARFLPYDETPHYFGYGILGMTSALKNSKKLFFYFLSWAFLDEMAQAFIPGRAPEFKDVLRNLAGLFAGITLVLIIRGIKRRGNVR